MVMSVEMIERVYSLDVTVMPTRYSTDSVPDIIFFMNDTIYRATWSIGNENGWVTRLTENEFHNIAPRNV